MAILKNCALDICEVTTKPYMLPYTHVVPRLCMRQTAGELAKGAYKENMSVGDHWWPGELSGMWQDNVSIFQRSIGT